MALCSSLINQWRVVFSHALGQLSRSTTNVLDSTGAGKLIITHKSDQM